MTIYRATAFSNVNGIEQKPVSGNPAGIVICTDGMPAKDVMKQMAIEINEPIVTFLSQTGEHAFDMKFYFPDGEECFLCGHGTLVAAHTVNRHFNYADIFLKIHEHDLVINCSVDQDKMPRAYLSSYSLTPMPAGQLPVYLSLLGLQMDEVLDTFYSRDLNDLVLVLKDGERLRMLSPDYKKLSAQIRQDHLRAVMITATSKNEEVDYEIRIFCPYVAEDEDISCGSANCYLLPYWKNKLHKDKVEDELVILCPFKPESVSFGGIEIGNFYADTNLVSISGRVLEIV